jgi:Ca2+-transporting ATPase
MLPNGKVVPMTDGFRARTAELVQSMAQRPLRCLLLAVKEGKDLGDLANLTEKDDPASHPKLQDPKNFEKIESDLTWVGITGIKDPARPEVAQAMTQCRDAGVRVIVITGDSKETAVAIARDVNIFSRVSH